MLFLISQGMPQTLGAYVDATTLEGAKQTIAVVLSLLRSP
jgi:K+-transporting ATPase ATPase A chain